MNEIIFMDNVIKKYKVHEKCNQENGVHHFFSQKEYEIFAVNQMNLNLEEGKILGYIGANGAGKSTTIKMLTGILVPTSGTIKVLGRDPYLNRRKNAEKIGIVFGQRSQLIWELPAIDTFRLNCCIYNIEKKESEERIKYFSDQMQITDIISRPVRKMSLGQRMCCEIVASLLHHPKILFMDEPTIGLDILNKERIRKLILQMNKEFNTTVFLTTHDLADVEYLCDDILIINKGKKVFGGSLHSLKDEYDIYHTITIIYDGEVDNIKENWYGLKCHHMKEERKIHIEFRHSEIAVTDIMRILAEDNIKIRDLSVHESSLEDIVKELYLDKQIKE